MEAIPVEMLQVAVAIIIIISPLATFLASYCSSKKMLEVYVDVNAKQIAELRKVVEAMDDDKVSCDLFEEVITATREDIKELKATTYTTRDTVIRLETSHKYLAGRIDEYFTK
jgi:bacterioferritin (cytochrome b1)